MGGERPARASPAAPWAEAEAGLGDRAVASILKKPSAWETHPDALNLLIPQVEVSVSLQSTGLLEHEKESLFWCGWTSVFAIAA